jgi:monovalent cation:H+ antiporter, CPA1 family
MSPFQITAILLTLTALGGYINQRYLRFPQTIGLMAFAFLLSLLAILLDKLGWVDLQPVGQFVHSINFSVVVLHGMLSFLLFAGALHLDIKLLRQVGGTVAILATVGVVIATFIIGTLFWLVAEWVGFAMPYTYALLFGALIAPTDPIAVLAILKESGLSKELYTKIGGESLFNDGVAIVIFTVLLGIATGTTSPTFTDITVLFLHEAVGGVVGGVILGWLTAWLMRSINDYKIEILLTLSLVTGGYVLAEWLHISAPIFMVVAGLIVGNYGRYLGLITENRARLDMVWELIDEIMNAVLFILIGLKIIVITVSIPHIVLGVLAFIVVLIGRFISVGLPLAAMSFWQPFDREAFGLLNWGGLRGGLSIAMALSLPASLGKDIILPATYIVVLFSILVQGLSFKPALKFLLK